CAEPSVYNSLLIGWCRSEQIKLSSVTSLLCVSFSDHKNVTAESGHDVILTCRAPNNNIVVKWSRADLESEYVLLYRDDLSVPDDQHPSFKNRVDLQDRQMKDGDVSLILKNVTVNDSGSYECRVFSKGRNNKPISIIHLHVDPPGQTGGHTEDGGKEDGSVGLIVGLVVSAVLLVAAVVCVLIYKTRKRQKQGSYQPSVELQSV
ncbi:butyrophilin-like protein 8, partial [Astatotilapia calliptera]|uniref:butyrophilin-like protein 8 n=1 Tax=Astatotilapia calliptera TaxID=8154 RepID=UPI000E41A854